MKNIDEKDRRLNILASDWCAEEIELLSRADLKEAKKLSTHNKKEILALVCDAVTQHPDKVLEYLVEKGRCEHG